MFNSIGNTLKELRSKCEYTQAETTARIKKLGIPIKDFHISRWEHGHSNPSIEQFLGLCKVYGVKDVFKTFWEHNFSDYDYSLNREGREKLEEYRNILIASGLFAPEPCDQKIVTFPTRTAPMYYIGVSAGTGQFLDSDDYDMVEVPDDVPISATFGLHVSGDSMEPTLHDGETIWVHMQPTLENGEIGIFLLDGDAYVKEYRCDETGCYLISHNKAYAPKKITEYNETKIYGKVVYPVR